jgi:hypothetical protein
MANNQTETCAIPSCACLPPIDSNYRSTLCETILVVDDDDPQAVDVVSV